MAEPGEIREANVLVGLMRGDALHGQDRGVLFAEVGKLGFRGERSAFLLPNDTYTVRRTELGATVLDVADGSTLFLAPRQNTRSGGSAMTAVLVLAGRDAPTDEVVEWPSQGPIGKARIRSQRLHQKISSIALAGILIAGSFIIYLLTKGMSSPAAQFLPLTILCPIFISIGVWRMPSVTDPKAKEGIAPLWSWLSFASLIVLGGVTMWRQFGESGEAVLFFFIVSTGGLLGWGGISLLLWFLRWSFDAGRRDGEARAIEEEVRDVAS